MHSLWSAAVPYSNYGTGRAFELPTQSGTYLNVRLINSYPSGTSFMTKQGTYILLPLLITLV